MSKENGDVPHTWVVIEVQGLSDEQAKEFVEHPEKEIPVALLEVRGPSCWVCEKEWAEVHDAACKGRPE